MREIFLEVTSHEISHVDAARMDGVDVSVIIRLRAPAKGAALASAKPGRSASAEQIERELLRAENEHISEALNGKLSHRTAPSPYRRPVGSGAWCDPPGCASDTPRPVPTRAHSPTKYRPGSRSRRPPSGGSHPANHPAGRRLSQPVNY